MKTILLMMNNYFHDFAVALLFSNLVLFYILVRMFRGELALNHDQMAAALHLTTRVTILALVWIAVGGSIRAWNYKTFEWVEAAGKGQIVALGIKHVVMGGCVVAGLWIQLVLTRRFKRTGSLLKEDS